MSKNEYTYVIYSVKLCAYIIPNVMFVCFNGVISPLPILVDLTSGETSDGMTTKIVTHARG